MPKTCSILTFSLFRSCAILFKSTVLFLKLKGKNQHCMQEWKHLAASWCFIFFFSVAFIRALNALCLFECYWTLRWCFNLQHNICGDCLWLVFNWTQHQFCCQHKCEAHCHVPFHCGLGEGTSLISYCNTWQSKLGEDSHSLISAFHFFLWINWGHWLSGVEDDIDSLCLKKKWSIIVGACKNTTFLICYKCYF